MSFIPGESHPLGGSLGMGAPFIPGGHAGNGVFPSIPSAPYSGPPATNVGTFQTSTVTNSSAAYSYATYVDAKAHQFLPDLGKGQLVFIERDVNAEYNHTDMVKMLTLSKLNYILASNPGKYQYPFQIKRDFNFLGMVDALNPTTHSEQQWVTKQQVAVTLGHKTTGINYWLSPRLKLSATRENLFLYLILKKVVIPSLRRIGLPTKASSSSKKKTTQDEDDDTSTDMDTTQGNDLPLPQRMPDMDEMDEDNVIASEYIEAFEGAAVQLEEIYRPLFAIGSVNESILKSIFLNAVLLTVMEGLSALATGNKEIAWPRDSQVFQNVQRYVPSIVAKQLEIWSGQAGLAAALRDTSIRSIRPSFFQFYRDLTRATDITAAAVGHLVQSLRKYVQVLSASRDVERAQAALDHEVENLKEDGALAGRLEDATTFITDSAMVFKTFIAKPLIDGRAASGPMFPTGAEPDDEILLGTAAPNPKKRPGAPMPEPVAKSIRLLNNTMVNYPLPDTSATFATPQGEADKGIRWQFVPWVSETKCHPPFDVLFCPEDEDQIMGCPEYVGRSGMLYDRVVKDEATFHEFIHPLDPNGYQTRVAGMPRLDLMLRV